MNFNIEIKNIDKIKRALNQSPRIVTKHIDTAIKRSIMTIQDKVSSLVPVDTGNLRQALVRDVAFKPLYGEIFPRTNYAYWVEVKEARHKVGQSHYLETSIEQSKDQVQKEFEKGLENALEEIASNT